MQIIMFFLCQMQETELRHEDRASPRLCLPIALEQEVKKNSVPLALATGVVPAWPYKSVRKEAQGTGDRCTRAPSSWGSPSKLEEHIDDSGREAPVGLLKTTGK